MAAPTANEIRAILEGYGVTTDVLTDAWLDDTCDNEIIPHIEDVTGQKFDGEQTVTEYYSGNGTSILMLNRKPVNELVSISFIGSATETDVSGSVELIGSEGILKAKTNYSEAIMSALFPKGEKNVKVTYKYGEDDYPTKVARAIMLMVAARALNTIGARTGGGSVSVQSHTRNYGSAGKYTDIRKEMLRIAYSLLRYWITGVVGS